MCKIKNNVPVRVKRNKRISFFEKKPPKINIFQEIEQCSEVNETIHTKVNASEVVEETTLEKGAAVTIVPVLGTIEIFVPVGCEIGGILRSKYDDFTTEPFPDDYWGNKKS